MNINFYQNNNLVLTQKEIHTLEKHYISSCTTEWKEFIEPIQSILSKSLPVKEYYKYQFDNGLGLQGGKILEIVVGDTLNHILDTTYIEKNKFENENYCIVLTGEEGKGTGSSFDISIIDKKNNKQYIGEIKDEIARCGECDLKYNEKGQLFPAPRSKNWDTNWQPILDTFNKNTSMFNIFGHNFKISQFTDICTEVAKNYFKDVDYLFTCKEDKLVTIPMNNFEIVKNLFSFEGSEIRSSGKNPVNVFTPNYMDNTICSSDNFIEKKDDSYIVYSNMLINKTGRGGGVSSRFGFIPGFIVKKEGVEFKDNNTCVIKKTSIKQLNSNISIHFKINANYEEIKNICKGEKC